MRKVLVTGFSLLLLAAAASAQVPSGNVFFGYSYYNTNLSAIDRTSTKGWEITVEGKVLPFIGLIADFDGHFGKQNFAETCLGFPCVIRTNFTENNYLFGPRVGIPIGKARPFVEAMAGLARVNVKSLGTDTTIGTAFGGGLDYKLFSAVSLRLQGDYVRTSFFHITQNSPRLSTGIVVHF